MPFTLDELFTVKQVSVVESIEPGRLSACLAWLVEQLQSKGQEQDGRAKEVEALKQHNDELRAAVTALNERQVSARWAPKKCRDIDV